MSRIVDSSLWQEEYYVRILFTTMLAKKDSDHVVRATAFNLHRWANITQEEVVEGLRILSSPDKRRLDPQENEGKRIAMVEDGWLVINGAKYEEMMSKIAEQARKAKWARENRARIRAERDAGTDEMGQADLRDNCEHGRPMPRKAT
jgi:hypothetical protein